MMIQPVTPIEYAMPAEPAPVLRGFATGVWHPEDLVVLPGTKWIVVSAMRSIGERGALFAVRTNDHGAAREIAWRPASETGRVGRAAFDPHGIDVRRIEADRFELLVVDHGGGEAIDRLELAIGPDGPVVVAGVRVVQPRHTSGNAVAHLPGGGFVMTSMFDPEDSGKLRKFADAAPTGRLWEWSEADGWRSFGPALSGANGVAVSPDGQHVIVSEWAARRVWRVRRDGSVMAKVDVDFLPDNLRWRDGRDLLLAGQVARPEAVFGCEARGERCPLAYAVVALDPETLKVRPLVRRSQAQAEAEGFGGATGALALGSDLWVGSFTGNRLARFAR